MDNNNFLNNLTVLYVEDSKIVLQKTIDTLKPLFKDIITANDGEEGLKQYINHKDNINIIISDINMPNMSGIDMIKRIKQIDSHIPCILTTSVVESATFIEAINIHITHYAIKPFDYDILIKQIKKACLLNYQKKSTENKIHKEEQYHKAIDSVALISRTDTHGKITYVNKSFCDISGYQANELIGNSHKMLKHPMMQNSLYDELWTTIKDGGVWYGIIKNKSKDGNTYFVKSYIFPIFNDKHHIKEYMSIALLVTTDEEAKRELRKGLIKNISSQKLANSSMLKENEQLKNSLNQLRVENANHNKELIFVQTNLENEKSKHKATKEYLNFTEHKLKDLEKQHDKLLKALKKKKIPLD
jgi:PAS domain S-box-containing protein